MRVYFSRNKYERAGKPLQIQKCFMHDGKEWILPAVYICAKGVVADFCVPISVKEIESIFTEYERVYANGKPSAEEREYLKSINPLEDKYSVDLFVNGKNKNRAHTSTTVYLPKGILDDCDFSDAEEYIEAYGLSREQGWLFIRFRCPWTTKRKPKIKTISFQIHDNPIYYPGPHFVTEGNAAKNITFVHPVTKEAHRLDILSCVAEQLPVKTFGDDCKDLEFPRNLYVLSYTVTPPCEITVRDCGVGDRPKRKGLADASCGCGIIGGADGPTAILLSPMNERVKTAFSEFRFDAINRVEWRISFFVSDDAVTEVEVNFL